MPPPFRPADLARLLLASGDLQPRTRARDQQADRAGMELKRRVLERLISLDPEPDEMQAALDETIREFGSPAGPTRAVAASVLEDWEAALSAPGFAPWLLEQALLEGEGGGERKRRRSHPEDRCPQGRPPAGAKPAC